MTATARVLWIFVFVIAACALRAQSFSVFDIDTSNFPIMKAKFYAFDAAGEQVKPAPSEITIIEDGIARKVLSITCPSDHPPTALSSVLVMDVSGSMTGRNLDIAKAAAYAWVDALPLGMSECALASFDDENYFNQDFTTSRTKLISAVSSLSANGGTDYDKALLLPVAGGLEITRLAKHERVIIFLTDGLCSNAQVNSIITEATRQRCRIFVITVGLACPQLLKDISERTGGQWYEHITTEQQIRSVYQRILKIAQLQDPCEIAWESGYSCLDGWRVLTVTWEHIAIQSSYPLLFESRVDLQFSPTNLFIQSKPIGLRFDTVITVTAIQGSFTVNDIITSNPEFQISPKNFTLAAGQSRSLMVSYTPSDSSYTWTQFEFQTDLCTKSYYASGGHIGYKPTRSMLKLVSPNGGELFVVGGDTTISWSGIPLTEGVRLEYSIDKGTSWEVITEHATSGRYHWRVPDQVSDKCLVRVTQKVPADETLNWVKRATGSSIFSSYALAFDAFDNIYVAGSFRDSANFGSVTLPAIGTDMFIAKYRRDGSLEWAKRAGGDDNGQSDYASGVVTDQFGNPYVVGGFYNSIDFDGIKLNSAGGGKNIFIAKYLSDGSIAWAKRAGGVNGENASSACSDFGGNLYIVGEFYGQTDFEGIQLTANGGRDGFIVKYSPNGDVLWAKHCGGPTNDDRVTDITSDPLGNIYVTGLFSSVADFSGTSLTSAGGSDVFTAKYDTDGNLAWAHRYGGKKEHWGSTIQADGVGNIYVAGYYGDSIDIGGITLTNNGANLFLAKIDGAGTVEWARYIADGGTNAYVAVDAFQNVYLTAGFQNSTTLDGIPISSTAYEDILIAKFQPNGKAVWAKYTGGTCGDDRGKAIALDNNNNLYVAGYFCGTVTFDDTTYKASLIDMFLWKIGNPILQVDISDAVFSIVKPLPVSEDIDMGNVLVGKSKDSVVTFIRNAGGYPFRVDSIAVLGSEFELVSGIPPFVVQAYGVHQVEFRFRPTSPGPKSAQIMIITQADTLYQTITGNGLLPTISTLGSIINFGAIEVSNIKDTTITVAITNNGTLPIDFTSDAQLGPDKTQFSLLSGGGAFTLQPNESREVSIRFAPQFIGRTSGRIGFNYNGPGSPAVLQLFGQGLGGLVRIVSDSAYPGEKRDVALELSGAPSANLQSLATGFRARVAYNSTVLAPFGGNVVRGSGVDTVTVEGNLNTDNSLTSIPFLAALGNAEVSSMDLVEFVWLDAQGQPANYDVETESGTFKVLGVCEEGGKRLFNPEGQVTITRISPNPASESVQVEIETIEAGRTQVVVMDVLGRTIATLYDGEIGAGSHKLNLNTSQIAAGSYYVSLVTPTVKKFARVDIAR